MGWRRLAVQWFPLRLVQWHARDASTSSPRQDRSVRVRLFDSRFAQSLHGFAEDGRLRDGLEDGAASQQASQERMPPPKNFRDDLQGEITLHPLDETV